MGGEKHIVYRVGEVHGRVSARTTEVAEPLRSADSAKVTTNLWGERWSKLVVNSMRNGLSAATGLSGNERDLTEGPRALHPPRIGSGARWAGARLSARAHAGDGAGNARPRR
jgi:2-dehydropantoate 2-reductase